MGLGLVLLLLGCWDGAVASVWMIWSWVWLVGFGLGWCGFGWFGFDVVWCGLIFSEGRIKSPFAIIYIDVVGLVWFGCLGYSSFWFGCLGWF